MHYALLDKLSQLAPPTIKEAIKDDDAYPLIFLSLDVFDVFFYFLLPYKTYIQVMRLLLINESIWINRKRGAKVNSLEAFNS